jgi:hypothetical protein
MAVNIILRVVIWVMVAYERHWTATDEVVSRGLYVFLLQFINTAAIILVLNAYMDSPVTILKYGELSLCELAQVKLVMSWIQGSSMTSRSAGTKWWASQ